ICGDFFGRKHATQNYGFLYTAKGTASVFVPIGSALAAGKAFDFRADVLLLLGGALAFFSHFLAPTILRIDWKRKTHDLLFGIRSCDIDGTGGPCALARFSRSSGHWRAAGRRKRLAQPRRVRKRAGC